MFRIFLGLLGTSAPVFGVGAASSLTAPVTITVFPALLSSGRSGEIAAYVSLCQVGTGEGNGGCIAAGFYSLFLIRV